MNPLYELEQPLLKTWGITDDLRVLVKNNAKPEHYEALAKVYDVHFNNLWDLFEAALRNTQRKSTDA